MQVLELIWLVYGFVGNAPAQKNLSNQRELVGRVCSYLCKQSFIGHGTS